VVSVFNEKRRQKIANGEGNTQKRTKTDEKGMAEGNEIEMI